MISPVSFTSTYKVHNQNPMAFAKFHDYAKSIDNGKDVRAIFKDTFTTSFNKTVYGAEETLIVPDKMDKKVEKFCNDNNIYYTKYDTDFVLNKHQVCSRLMTPPVNYTRVIINPEKLEEFIENQNSNIYFCKNQYEQHYAKDLNAMIKSGHPLPVTTLHIDPVSNMSDFTKYIEEFGAANLNDKQVFVTFEQKTSKPDHCMYFALKDIGVGNIPVFVDFNTSRIGRMLNLF